MLMMSGSTAAACASVTAVFRYTAIQYWMCGLLCRFRTVVLIGFLMLVGVLVGNCSGLRLVFDSSKQNGGAGCCRTLRCN